MHFGFVQVCVLSEWQSAVLILIPDSFIFGNYFFGRQANRANVKSVTNILWKFGSLLDQSDPIQETDYNAMITIHRQSALSTLLISMSRSFLGAWTLAVSSSWLLAGHDSLPHLDLNLKICCFKLLHGYFYHFYQHVLQVFLRLPAVQRGKLGMGMKWVCCCKCLSKLDALFDSHPIHWPKGNVFPWLPWSATKLLTRRPGLLTCLSIYLRVNLSN